MNCSELYPVASFSIGGVEPFASITRELYDSCVQVGTLNSVFQRHLWLNTTVHLW
jgi:hypothetical protein